MRCSVSCIPAVVSCASGNSIRGCIPLRNSNTHFGAISQLFHGSVAALFVFEYVVTNLMLRIKAGETRLGITQGWLYT